MTITEAVRRKLVVVFCPRCEWKLIDCAFSLMQDKCPGCKQYGLDAVEPYIIPPI